MGVFSAGFQLYTRTRGAAQKAVRETQMIERSMVSANKRVAKSMSLITTAAATAGAAVVTIGKNMSDAATAFDHGIRRVASLSAGKGFAAGLVDDLKEWQDAIQDIALTSDDDIIEGMYQLRSAGLDVNKVLNVGKGVASAARAEYVSFSEAVNLGTTAAKAFGLGLDQTDDVLNLFSGAVTLGKTTLGEMSESLFQVAPSAVAAKVGINETVASMVALTNQGVPTRQAATWMGQAFTELTKAGTIASDNFEDIAGVAFPAFIANGGTLGEALALIDEHLTSSGSSAVDFFSSIEAGKAVQTLLNGSVDEYNRLLDEMSSNSTAVADKLEVVNAGLDAQRKLVSDLVNDHWKNLGGEFAKLEMRAIGLAGSLGILDNETQKSSAALRALASDVQNGDGDFALHLETLRAYGIEVSRNFETNREFRHEIARLLREVALLQEAESEITVTTQQWEDAYRDTLPVVEETTDAIDATTDALDEARTAAQRFGEDFVIAMEDAVDAASAGSQVFALSLDALNPATYSSVAMQNAIGAFRNRVARQGLTNTSNIDTGTDSGTTKPPKTTKPPLTPFEAALAGLSSDVTSASLSAQFLPSFVAHLGEMDNKTRSVVERLAEAGVSLADLDESQLQYIEDLDEAGDAARKAAKDEKKAAEDKAAADKLAAEAAAALEQAARAASSMLASLAGVSAGYVIDPATGKVTGRQSSADAAIAGTTGTINDFLTRFGVGASGGRRALGALGGLSSDTRITSGPFAGLTVGAARALVDEVEEAYAVREFQIGERDEANRIAAGTAGYGDEDHAFALASVGGASIEALESRRAQLQKRLEFARTTATKEDDRRIELAIANIGNQIEQAIKKNRSKITVNDEELIDVEGILDGIDALRLGRGTGRCS